MSKKKDRAEEQAGGARRDENIFPGTSRSPSPDQNADAPPQAPLTEAASAGAASAPPPDAASTPHVSPEDRLRALEAEALDLRDKLLRKQADFENFRKRMIRERDDAARYANAALLTDVIATIDDFERAIRSAEESRDFDSFFQGVSMIEKQLLDTLESRWGLRRFASTGEGFDPNRHEAVLRVEGPADARPTVVEDYQKGYFLHERVLRPARVKVMVPAQAAATQAADPAAPATDAAQAAGANGKPEGSC
jgi:molecular chaperone GrpE